MHTHVPVSMTSPTPTRVRVVISLAEQKKGQRAGAVNAAGRQNQFEARVFWLDNRNC